MQEPQLNEAKTVLGNVEEGVGEIKVKLDRYNEIAEEMAEPDADFDALMAEMGTLQEDIDAADAWDLDSQLEQAMDALRCPPPDADVTVLSGGERRRVALCKLLLQKPDLLLLDEPTNHLDAESRAVARAAPRVRTPVPSLAVTHDRYFLDNVAQWILELDRGRAYPYEGNYSTYLEKKQARLQVQGKKDAKLAKRLATELEWVRSNAKGRQTKSKARLARYEEMAAEADRTRKLDFEEIQIPPGPRLGNLVIEVNNLRKGFGDRVLIDDLSFTLPAQRHRRRHRPQRRRQDHALQDDRRPRGARRRRGQGRRDGEDRRTSTRAAPAWTRRRTSGRPCPTASTTSRSARSRSRRGPTSSQFGFKGPDQQKPAGVLSGGERNRLNLALTLKQGGNLLLLDEPTNDLDVETLGSLENALLEFPGCAVVISHDRWFLDRVATHILAYEGDDENPASGSGSRATSSPTRRTRSSASAPTPRVRTG